MYVLGIIPARCGSKSVQKKNIRLLAGKPLIAYTIETAQKCKILTRTVVSTDDDLRSCLSECDFILRDLDGWIFTKYPACQCFH